MVSLTDRHAASLGNRAPPQTFARFQAAERRNRIGAGTLALRTRPLLNVMNIALDNEPRYAVPVAIK
jgi:hypothetical protein